MRETLETRERKAEMTKCLLCEEAFAVDAFGVATDLSGDEIAEMYDAQTAEFLPGEEQGGIVHFICGESAGWELA
jgi:hypothetical protein